MLNPSSLEARLERLLTSKGEALSSHLRLRHDKASVLRNTRRILDETERMESLYAELLPIVCGLDAVVYDPSFTAASAPPALLALFYGSTTDAAAAGMNRKQNGSQNTSTLATSIESSTSMSMSPSSSSSSLFQSDSVDDKISNINVDNENPVLAADAIHKSNINKVENDNTQDTQQLISLDKREGEEEEGVYSTTNSISIEESTESKAVSGSEMAHSIIEAARARARLRASSVSVSSSSSSSSSLMTSSNLIGQDPIQSTADPSKINIKENTENDDDDVLLVSLSKLSIPSLPQDPSLILSSDALFSSVGVTSTSSLPSPSYPSHPSSSSSSSMQGVEGTDGGPSFSSPTNETISFPDSTSLLSKQTEQSSAKILSSSSPSSSSASPIANVELKSDSEHDKHIEQNTSNYNKKEEEKEETENIKQMNGLITVAPSSSSSSSSFSNTYIASPIASAMHAARVELGRNADHTKSRAKEVIETVAEISAAHKERIAPAALLQQQLEAIRAREAKARLFQSFSNPRGASNSQLEDENSSIAAMLARVASAAVAAASVPVVSYTSINSRQGSGVGNGDSKSQKTSPKTSPKTSSPSSSYERQRQTRSNNNTLNMSSLPPSSSSTLSTLQRQSKEWPETNQKMLGYTASSSSSSSSSILPSAIRLGLNGRTASSLSSSDATPLPMSLLQSPTSPTGPSRAASPTLDENELNNIGFLNINLNTFNGHEDAAENLFSALLYQAASRFDDTSDRRDANHQSQQQPYPQQQQLPVDGDLREALQAANSQFESLNFDGEVYRNSGNDDDNDDDGSGGGGGDKISPRSMQSSSVLSSSGFRTPLAISAPPFSRSINGRQQQQQQQQHQDSTSANAHYKFSSPPSSNTNKRQNVMRPPFDTNLVVRYSPSGKPLTKKRSPAATAVANTRPSVVESMLENFVENNEDKSKAEEGEQDDEEEEEGENVNEKEVNQATENEAHVSSSPVSQSKRLKKSPKQSPRPRLNRPPVRPLLPQNRTNQRTSRPPSASMAPPLITTNRLGAGPFAEVLQWGLHDNNRLNALDSRHLMRARLLKQQQMAFRSRKPPPGLLVRQQKQKQEENQSADDVATIVIKEEEEEGGGGGGGEHGGMKEETRLKGVDNNSEEKPTLQQQSNRRPHKSVSELMMLRNHRSLSLMKFKQ
jgi:hypothetical protein